ncbi:hypothetical protein GCM10009550_49240 [Actinocorallia libanotica]|uniref:Uncharacterized protein n=1 Tax=Actinocorallia libanotica TaxID=46162 RepID=A0ABN1RLD9_9ACTN
MCSPIRLTLPGACQTPFIPCALPCVRDRRGRLVRRLSRSLQDMKPNHTAVGFPFPASPKNSPQGDIRDEYHVEDTPDTERLMA